MHLTEMRGNMEATVQVPIFIDVAVASFFALLQLLQQLTVGNHRQQIQRLAGEQQLAESKNYALANSTTLRAGL